MSSKFWFRCLVFLFMGSILLGATCYSKQPNLNYIPTVEDPRYLSGEGPSIWLEQSWRRIWPDWGFRPPERPS